MLLSSGARVNPANPVDEVIGEHGITLNKIRQPAGFLFECEGCEAAEDQSER